MSRPIAGRDLKDFFTKSVRRRYHEAMLVLAASLVLSAPNPPRPATGATAHAQAIIRIVSGVRVRFDAPSDDDAPRPRDTEVRGAGPELLPARLVEFE